VGVSTLHPGNRSPCLDQEGIALLKSIVSLCVELKPGTLAKRAVNQAVPTPSLMYWNTIELNAVHLENTTSYLYIEPFLYIERCNSESYLNPKLHLWPLAP
jgi:hypothetical protein